MILLLGPKLEFAQRAYNSIDQKEKPVESSSDKNGTTVLFMG